MIEIRWHGRGGQGAKTVSQLLAGAALRHGHYVQAFPEYGPERSGAPVKAFNRLDTKEIRLHCSIYEPDIVVVLDPTLLSAKEARVTEGLKRHGILLVNTAQTPVSDPGADGVFREDHHARRRSARPLSRRALL
jgi:pyruvate ferredoxin oxidoreductase gamma subunit